MQRYFGGGLTFAAAVPCGCWSLSSGIKMDCETNFHSCCIVKKMFPFIKRQCLGDCFLQVIYHGLFPPDDTWIFGGGVWWGLTDLHWSSVLWDLSLLIKYQYWSDLLSSPLNPVWFGEVTYSHTHLTKCDLVFPPHQIKILGEGELIPTDAVPCGIRSTS